MILACQPFSHCFMPDKVPRIHFSKAFKNGVKYEEIKKKAWIEFKHLSKAYGWIKTVFSLLNQIVHREQGKYYVFKSLFVSREKYGTNTKAKYFWVVGFPLFCFDTSTNQDAYIKIWLLKLNHIHIEQFHSSMECHIIWLHNWKALSEDA